MNIRILAAVVLATNVRHGREAPSRPTRRWSPRTRARTIWAALGDRGAETRAQTAIRFGLAPPGVATVVVGAADLAHVNEVLAAPNLGPLEEEVLAALQRAWTDGVFRTPSAS